MDVEAPDEAERAMLATLAILVECYEETEFPAEKPPPTQAIRFRMDQLDLTRSRLADLVGLPRSRISEVLNGRRPLTLPMIRALHEKLRIQSDILISPEPPSASS